MKPFENILFATQGFPGYVDALGQAMRIAVKNHAQISGLIACQDFPSHLLHYQQGYEQTLHRSLLEHVEGLRVENNVTEEQMPFALTVKGSEKPAVCIIQQAVHHNNDLIIKEAEPLDEDGEGVALVDITLLRESPYPVWLQRPFQKPERSPHIAVAIDPMVESEEERALSLRLLKLSSLIASIFNSRLHILSCWEYYLEHYLDDNAWIHVEEAELAEKISQAKVKHEQTLQSLIKESGISDNPVAHLLHGIPGEKIPEYTAELEIDVLVMGTLARTGISGFFIGNTAENVLKSISCSLVAIKPEGFESSIE